MTYDTDGVASGGRCRSLWSFAPLFIIRKITHGYQSRHQWIRAHRALVFRAICDQGLLGKEIEVVAVNDIVPPTTWRTS